MRSTFFRCLPLVALAVAGLSTKPAASDAVSDFYAGKTLTLIVGTDPGGPYDIYARLLARHIVRHIPGNPTISLQYMPGAGSVIATNHVYNVAPQDGTVIFAASRSVALGASLGASGVRYEAAKMFWLGTLNVDVGVLQIWLDRNIKTIEDARANESIIGATSPLTDSVQYPSLLNNTIGTKFKVVPGYTSNAAAQLALEKREVDGLGNSYSAMIGKFKDWREKMTVPVQFSLSKHPQMQDIPLVSDVVKPEYALGGLSVEQIKELWTVILVQQEMGRSFGVGPGVPADRVAALRTAFKLATEDPELRAEAAKGDLEVSPRDGNHIQMTVANVAKASPETMKRLQDLTQYKGK